MTSPKASVLHRLRVAQEANAAAYRRAVQTSAPGDCWDYLVLTAANEKQAQGYRQELALRHRAVGPTGSFFPAIQKSLVVPDPPGRRAGSGGATLGVLQQLAQQFNLRPAHFDNLRILLIHSGGASQRMPAYSPLGKIFAPLPLLRPDGQISTLFDHLYLTLAGLPERLGPGMLIVAGDVFLLFDHRHVSAPPPGVTALSMRVEADMGRGHGVFVTDPQQRIQQTLQKVSVETMRQAGAANERDEVLIDTGLLFFDAPRTQCLASLAGCGAAQGKPNPRPLHERYPQQIDLYEDMTQALAAATQRQPYLADPATAAMRQELWQTLHGVDFQVMQLEGQFLHLGTTRQFRDAMVGHNPSPAAELFQQNVLAQSQWALENGRRVYHSVLLGTNGQAGVVGPGSVVEHSILGTSSRIGAGSVVSQVRALRKPLELGDNLLLFQVPVRDEKEQLAYVHVLCGVEDDFKGRFSDGKCLFLNKPIEQWLALHDLKPQDLWPDSEPPKRRPNLPADSPIRRFAVSSSPPADQRTLWTARLFVPTPQRDEAGAVLWFAQERPAAKTLISAWKKARRYSMAMLLEQADPLAMIAHRETVAAHLQANSLLDSLANNEDRPLDSFIGHYSSPAAYEASLQQLLAFATPPSAEPQRSIRQSRAFWCAAQLLQRPDYPASTDARTQADQHVAQAFAKIAEASELANASITVQSTDHLAIRPGQRVVASSPVRLDLSGGWTDSPPYCYERGGHVVNVAIDLNGQPPVRAVVRTINEPVLILETHDLGQHIELKSIEPPPRDRIVHDPFALHKVAMGLLGLLPERCADLSRHMKKLGGGLIVSTECRVPKGSGLGTSSILAATLLAALHQVVGRPATPEQLITETLLLEQRLSTGGGWQDQVGGIVGGVKSTLTAPGLPQQPLVEPLALTDEIYAALQERLVVYYSGQQRLARDILRRVIGRWIGREPSVLLLMDELKHSAAALRAALLKGQWIPAARHIQRYWEIKKQLYPGSTTPTIDVLFLEMQGEYLAAGLAGAGGGGFAYFFCKDARQAGRLRQRLAEQAARPGSMGSLFATQINRTGLSLTGNSL